MTNLSATEISVERQLQAIVEKVDHGEKLPSLRQLSDAIGVSVPVVDRYLSKMEAAGQIFIKPRSGAYKSMPILRRLEILCMNPYTYTGEYNFQYHCFSCLVSRLACAQRQVRVHDLGVDAEPVRLGGIGDPTTSLVITFTLRRDQIPVVESLAEAGVPMVHVLPNFTHDIAPAIRIDDHALVRRQVECLYARGLRRIAYLHAVGHARSYSRAWTERYDAFCRLAVEMGLETHPEYVHDVGPEGDGIPAAVDAMLRAATPPEAVVIYDHHARILYNALRARGIEPGRDLAVMGTDDMPWSQMLSPALSSIRVSLQSLNRKLLDAIVRLESGRKVGVEYVALETVERET